MHSARRSSNACSIGKCRDLLIRTPAGPASFSLLPTARFARRLAAGVPVAIAVAWGCLALAAAPPPAGPLSAAPQAVSAAPQPVTAAPAGETAQPAPAPAGEAGRAAEGGEGEAGHGESVWATLGRLVNFALLAGTLFYFLRSPITTYLQQRRVQVRSDLTRAAEMKVAAAEQMAGIEAKMRALPDEIAALGRRGAEEIAAEGVRMEAQAAAERQRLLEQARREIDAELRVAERELKTRAGELAVAVATERVKGAITGADQARLIDRYVAQVEE